MRGAKNKTWHLTVLLLKEEINSFEAALKESDKLNAYPLISGLPFTGALYIKKPSKKEPRWAVFLNKLVLDFGTLQNQTNAACLFIKAASRIFVFTFGYGRGFLNSDAHVTDFGLKVALNTVDADRLRTVDAKSIEELTVHTRRQASRASSLEVFGIDVSRDLLRAVTGEPKDKLFAKRLTGADALAFASEMEILELGKKCEQFLVAYESDSYKERFDWVDNLNLERDKKRINELNRKLLLSLKGDRENIYLAAPELIDWGRVEGFKYSPQGNDKMTPELELESYISSFWENIFTVEQLKRDKVEVFVADQTDPVARWSIYQCFVYETEMNNSNYVLSGGLWFRVAKTFSEEVDDYLLTFPQDGCLFPDAKANEKEPEYNQRYANTLGLHAALLDGSSKLVQRIEVCDVFTSKKQFMHIKRKNRSSTLSHLFAQGSVSGELFFRDAKFREGAKSRVFAVQPSLAGLIPAVQPNPRDFEITYGIIVKNTNKWPLSLPFFSRLHFKQASERLKAFGYQVKLCPIKIS